MTGRRNRARVEIPQYRGGHTADQHRGYARSRYYPAMIGRVPYPCSCCHNLLINLHDGSLDNGIAAARDLSRRAALGGELCIGL